MIDDKEYKILESNDNPIKCTLFNVNQQNILKIETVIDGTHVDFKVMTDAKNVFSHISQSESKQLYELLYDNYLAKMG